jgi:putative selenate reductase
MIDRFNIFSAEQLLGWILAEAEADHILGIHRGLFFTPTVADPFRLKRYGRLLETPIGVAAGPHTQLTQNLVAAWLCGARYLELKTVQVLDDLKVTKPCIDMQDEGYNCEWSQELRLEESFSQYLDAWILLHVLRHHLGWDTATGPGGQGPGFIFNMSAGYNLEGIQSAAMQRFFDRMHDCEAEKNRRVVALAKVYPAIEQIEIPGQMSDNVTVSTMHGCPPEEIEKIGRYFIEARGLHTTIKLNPTLLGPERLRGLLNDALGFPVTVPDIAFEHDLKYDAGCDLIRALTDSADKKGVSFGLKLTNTLETVNAGRYLPEKEQMLYMSGRALHPISIHLAARLQEAFDGRLAISFCAGLDCFNLAPVLRCGFKPVTVCSDLLKPGGYGRLGQYLDQLERAMFAEGATSLDEWVQSPQETDLAAAGLARLKAYADRVAGESTYQKRAFPYAGIKAQRPLEPFDCIAAPCVAACAASQDIPRYLAHTARGEFDQALDVIRATNPFPNVQGMVCDHLCQAKCTRMNYDSPLLIREIKRYVAQKAGNQTGEAIVDDTGGPLSPVIPDDSQRMGPASDGESLRKATTDGDSHRIAIVGAGPSGLACAYFLARAGFAVEIFEGKHQPGGMAADGIPEFRLDDRSLATDIDAIRKLGVEIHTGVRVDADRFEALRKTFDYLYIAIGAQNSLRLGIPGESAKGVWDQLAFLSAVRRGEAPEIGKSVAVIGGGNAAMDAARTALRLVGPDGRVHILYRRTRAEMPADAEEIQAALDEGIELVELTAPECVLAEDGWVTSNLCFRMRLGEPDASGRPRPTRIEGSEFKIAVDTVISAIGQSVAVDFLPDGELKPDPVTLETQLSDVFAGGDAVRGAASLILAIGDGRRAAEGIARKAGFALNITQHKAASGMDPGALEIQRARRIFGPEMPQRPARERADFELVSDTLEDAEARAEARRCLQCDLLCNICVTVCPNRANIAYTAALGSYPVVKAAAGPHGVTWEVIDQLIITQGPQVLNLGDACNHCGNCTSFCPTSGAPYLDKPRFYLSEAGFDGDPNAYRLVDGVLYSHLDGHSASLRPEKDGLIYEDEAFKMWLEIDTLKVMAVAFKKELSEPVLLSHATRMGLLWTSLHDFYLFSNRQTLVRLRA